ncbi:hypothetical protein P7C73_g3406, partial [Tremellales sp. Uapishka_1]
MRSSVLLSVLSSVFLASSAMALEYTTTLGVGQYLDGNTVVVSVGTNALGVAVTSTLSTIEDDDVTAAVTNTVTNPLTAATTTTRALKTTTTKKATTATATTRPTATTGDRVIGGITTDSIAPMQTTTYWYEGTDGVWVQGTWSASVVIPTVATAVVPAGSIVEYNSYQASANSVVLASAIASNSASAGRRGMQEMSYSGVGGWAAMVMGMVAGGAMLAF